MCGIAGIVEFRGNEARNNQRILKKMSDIIVHRGPDADGQWLSEDRQCGMSFRRLAIIDLTPLGNQPMPSMNNNATIVFNGEIYNHEEIREDLIKRGYKYRSTADTETIMNGYFAYGEAILQKLHGMWGFAIWDADRKELFAARDRIGIKPFYYYYKDGLFVFGSEIKSLLEHPDVPKEMNIDQIPNYLNFGASSGEDTMFKHIKKLPPGHCLRLSDKDGLRISRYWSPYNKCNAANKFEMSEKEIFDELINLLRRSIKDRMMSDVPFGAFLSGGIDSSLNVALMAELMNRPVDTYTIGFKELEKYNELKYARQISDLYKTNHHEIVIDDKDGFDILEKLPFYEDEPNLDPTCIPLYYLSKLTRESGTIVVQVGEGSDEQFCGYNWMLRDWKFQNNQFKIFSGMPSVVKKMIHAAASPILNGMNLELASDYIRRGVHNEKFFWSGQSFYSPTHLSKLFNPKFAELSGNPYKHVQKMYAESAALNPHADDLQEYLFLELSQRLSEMLLMRVDKIGMAHSIEARVPFLDHRIVEFTMSIPQNMKMPDMKTTKYLLKKAVEPILPHDIIYRRKQGFTAPMNEWLAKQWHSYTKDNILNSELSKLGIFNKDYMKSILLKHKEGKTNAGTMIYSMLNLHLWYKQFWG